MLADKEAKSAIHHDRVALPLVPHMDMKWPIRTYIRKKWQNRWSSQSDRNLKYKGIRPTVEIWKSSFQENRSYETRLSRLRIGHTYLTHKHLWQGDDAPVCDVCDVYVTVHHILVDCRKYNNLRNKYQISRDIAILLGDNVNCENLMNFLKEIGIFHEI